MKLSLESVLRDVQAAVFLEQMSTGFAELRADPKAWAEEQAERAVWETTSADGLADE